MNRIEEAMHACRLCPRMCGVDRLHGKIGYCGEKAVIVAARAALHRWEEPCISGTGGSGTVFLSGCTLRCVFCQNREIAAGHSGREISLDRLAEIFLELQEKGAHNINLVTPTHYSVCLAEALKKARANGLTIPVIYNTSGYERPEILREMEPYIDIYMPDFKYIDAETAAKYSHAADYFEVAKAALAEMVHQQPQPVWDENGMLTKGVLVRHLVLPGHTGESIRILQYLHEIRGIHHSEYHESVHATGRCGASQRNFQKINARRVQKSGKCRLPHGNHTGLYSGRRNRQRELYSTFFG